MLDEGASEYKFYSFEQKCFHGFPEWRAGVIAGVPSAATQNGPVDFPDLLDIPDKSTALNTSGFRVETLPDPNDDTDKSMSKQYRYVPLRSIRPLAHWQLLLKGIKQKRLHQSILYALTCMTSVSLLEKWRFNGDWPNAHVSCRGLYFGSELITIGDAVRLNRRDKPNKCTDVLVVDSIRLKLLDIKAEHVQPNTPYLASRSSISLVGRALSTDIRRHYQMPSQQRSDSSIEQLALPAAISSEELKSLLRPVGGSEYGSWYDMHPSRNRYEVSYDQVLGRMYEADAVRLWTGQLQHKLRNGERPQHKPSLDFDIGSIVAGRQYASQTDERLPEPQASDQVLWHWTDSRAEGLAIESFHGLEVGKYYDVRDMETLKFWQKQLSIIDNKVTNTEMKKAVNYDLKSYLPSGGGTRGRKPGTRVVNGKVVYPGDEGYDEAGHGVDAQGSPQGTPSKPKGGSQMIAAGLADASEADTGASNDDSGGDSGGYSDLEMLPEAPRPKPTLKAKPAPTKQQIMASVEGNDEFEDDYMSADEEDWFDAPLPLVRGGTEESEGGDYDPRTP